MLAALAMFIAGLIIFCTGLAGLLVLLMLRYDRRTRGQGTPRWTPDPAFDPALYEDTEVATLDAIWEMPAGNPRAW